MHKNRAFAAFCLLTVLAFFFASAFIFYKYTEILPWSWSWDMDATTAIDHLLINQGQLPSHLAHPSLGQTLIHQSVERVIIFFTGNTEYSYETLKRFVNPILGFAEVSDSLRYQNFLISSMIPLLLSLSIFLLFPKQPALWVIAAALFFSDTNLQSKMFTTRSETFSIFFWSIGILLFAYAASQKLNSKIFPWFFVIVGVSLGVSFTSKVQSLFYIAASPFLYLIFCIATEKKNLFPKIHSPYLNIIVALVFVGLYLFTWGVDTSKVETFRSEFTITGQFIAASTLIIILLTLTIVSLHAPSFQKKIPQMAFKASASIGLLLLGFLLSFLIPILFYPLTSTVGLNHSIILFKVVFLGVLLDSASGVLTTFDWHIENLVGNLIKNYEIFLCLFSSFLFFIGFSKKGTDKNCITLMFFVVFINQIAFSATGIRSLSPKDFIWSSTLPLFLTFVLTGFTFKNFKYSSNLKYLFLVFFIPLFLIQLEESTIPKNFVWGKYKFRGPVNEKEKFFVERVYKGQAYHEAFFIKEMGGQENVLQGLLQTRILSGHFPLPPSEFLSNLGIITRDFKFNSDGVERIHSYSPSLEGRSFLYVDKGIKSTEIFEWAESIHGLIFKKVNSAKGDTMPDNHRKERYFLTTNSKRHQELIYWILADVKSGEHNEAFETEGNKFFIAF